MHCTGKLAVDEGGPLISFLAAWVYTPRNKKPGAGPLEKFTGSVTRMAEEPFKKFMINEENRQFLLYDNENNQAVQINLKDRLGSGYFGSVYVVDDLKGAPLHLQKGIELSQEQNTQLVAKFPHALKYFAMNYPLFLAELENRTELRTYRKILARRKKYIKNSAYPQDPPWSSESLPIVPIVGSIKTSRGTIIMKPKVLPGALDLKDVAKIFRENGNLLPIQMKSALRDVYDFVKYSADIRPTNFVFIEDAANLKLFGYRRPGFIVYEFSRVPFNKRQYVSPVMTFNGYLEEFESYLRKDT